MALVAIGAVRVSAPVAARYSSNGRPDGGYTLTLDSAGHCEIRANRGGPEFESQGRYRMEGDQCILEITPVGRLPRNHPLRATARLPTQADHWLHFGRQARPFRLPSGEGERGCGLGTRRGQPAEQFKRQGGEALPRCWRGKTLTKPALRRPP